MKFFESCAFQKVDTLYLLKQFFIMYIHQKFFFSFPENKPEGLKVAREDLRLMGSMVDRLDG